MTECRCWLVEREFTQKGLVTLVYATPDGERKLTRQRSTTILQTDPATAAIDVLESALEPVTDADRRERYASEAARMADRHDPEDAV